MLMYTAHHFRSRESYSEWPEEAPIYQNARVSHHHSRRHERTQLTSLAERRIVVSINEIPAPPSA